MRKGNATVPGKSDADSARERMQSKSTGSTAWQRE